MCVRAHETTDNFLLLSLDKGLSGRIQPGGVERVDLLGAAGRRGALDEDQEIPDDRAYRPVSLGLYAILVLRCDAMRPSLSELQRCAASRQ